MLKMELQCHECGKMEYRFEETGSIVSECICNNKRVECGCCGHWFLRKDMSMNHMFLALCKLCNQHEPHLMDNVAVSRFRAFERPAAMLCVQLFGDKLQLTMRVYHLGRSIVFPGMTKQELMKRWFQDHPGFHETLEADFLFNAAFLRLKEDKYITHDEIVSFRRQMFQEVKAIKQDKAAIVGV